MLTNDSGLEAVADVRVPFSMGACLPSAVGEIAQPRKGAVVFARPRAYWAADVFGRRHPVADPAMALQQPSLSKQNNPYTTRIAASGGTKGPHPAREPDPV